ncbi:hypothetical protein ACHAXA_000742 [Cyclostephanos tholiformis]|uniref:Uncharacterized protein n=1 Tax=Cyclostephanos tholiformis TaxID=382380 RepID=A0ABD3RVH6_9STRA
MVTRQLNLWGFRRLGAKNIWYNQYFIRGSVEGLEYIQRVAVKKSDTSKIGPPKRRSTFDSSELKRGTALSIVSLGEMSTKNSLSPEEVSLADSMALFLAMSRLNTGYEIDVPSNNCSNEISEVTMPNSETKALEKYRQISEVTMPNHEAVLVQALKKYQQYTQNMALPPDRSRPVEKKQRVAVPMTPPPFPQGSLIRTAEQHHWSVVSMSPSSHPPKNDSMDPEQQQQAEVTFFQQMLPTFVFTMAGPFADDASSGNAYNASVQANAHHKSFPSSSSWPQVKANSSHRRLPSSNVERGTFLSGRQVHQPSNDDTDDNFPLLVSQILDQSQDVSFDGDLCSILGLSSNDLEREFMDPISF